MLLSIPMSRGASKIWHGSTSNFEYKEAPAPEMKNGSKDFSKRLRLLTLKKTLVPVPSSDAKLQ